MTIDDSNERCAYCQDTIRESEWHPVRSVHDEDGELHILAFCGEECVEAWSEDDSPLPSR